MSTQVKVAGEEGSPLFDFGKVSNPLATFPVSIYVYIGVVSQGEWIKGQEFEVQRDPHGHLVPKSNRREWGGLVGYLPSVSIFWYWHPTSSSVKFTVENYATELQKKTTRTCMHQRAHARTPPPSCFK